MNYTKALERIRGKLMENPDTAKRISEAEKLAQDELDRQDATKDGGYKVIMALPKSLTSDKHLNVCLAKRNFSAYDDEKKTFIAWTSLNTSHGGLNHGHYDLSEEEASKILFEAIYDELKINTELDWMDKPRVELAKLVKKYCGLLSTDSNVVDEGDWRIRDNYEKKSWDAAAATGRQLLTKGDFELYRKNGDGLYVRVAECKNGMFEFRQNNEAEKAMAEIASFDTPYDLTRAVVDAAKDFEEPIQIHLDSPLLITDDEIKKAVEKAIDEESDKNGDIEIYADYNDQMSKDTAIEILGKDDPQADFFDKMYEWYEDEQRRIEDNLTEKAMQTLAESHYGLSDTDWFSYDGEYLVRDEISEKASIKYPEEHFLDQVFNVNIYLDTGNANTDFGDDVLPGHWEYNDYYRSGQDKNKPVTLAEAMENIPDTSSILWLAKQQGYTKEQLAKALIAEEKTGDKFLDSVRSELANAPYANNTLVFLTRMTLKELMDMNEAMNNPLKDGSITLPKGTECGLFNYWNGSGSVFEIETQKDIKIPADNIFTCMPDGYRQYDIDNVYGLVGSVWDSPTLCVENKDREITCKNFTEILQRHYNSEERRYADKSLGDSYRPLDPMRLSVIEMTMKAEMSEDERKKYDGYLKMQDISPDSEHTDFLQSLVTGEKHLVPPSALMEKSVSAGTHFDMEKEISEMEKAKKEREKSKETEIKSPEKALPQRTRPAHSRSDDFGRGL